MNYLGLFLPHNLALLSDWLNETGELYVDIDLPHSGASGSAYFLHSMNDLKSLISQQIHPEIVISVFHYRQYPIRGIADEALLQEALQHIPDGEWYAIIALDDVYPSSVSQCGSGNSHRELQREFAEVLGKKVGIGQNPHDVHAGNWFRLHPNEVLRLSVSRNQNYYEPYAQEPEKYKWILESWQE